MRTLAALILALLVVPGALAKTATPRLVLTPAESPPGQVVTITGSGFCVDPGCSGVDVLIAGVPVASDLAVSGDGSFSVRGSVPGGRIGEVGVTATQRLANGSESTAFALLKVIALIKKPTSAQAKVALLRVRSPVAAGAYAVLTVKVSKPARCSIAVYYKSGRSQAQGLHPKRTDAQRRVSWKWKVSEQTTPGRWPIAVSCGSAGTLRTSFVVR